MKNYIVDACAWIEFFEGNEKFKPLIEGNFLKTPTTVVTEVVKALSAKKTDFQTIAKAAAEIREKSTLLELDFETAVRAGRISVDEKLPFADALVYAFVNEENELLTADSHFTGKPFVKLVK